MTTLQDLQRAVETGNYYVARQCFLELLVQPDAPLPQVFCEMSVGEYQFGNLKTALTFAEAGEKLLANQSTPQPALLAHLRNNMVAFYLKTGDCSRAITSGLRWLDGLKDAPAPSADRGQMYYNLALAYRQRGGPHDHREALHLYELARRDFRESYQSSPDEKERAHCSLYEVMAVQNEAWLQCELGDLNRAQENADLASKLLSDRMPELRREQVLLGAYLAYSRGDFADCARHLHEARPLADESTPRQQFWAEWLSARVSIKHGQHMLASIHSTLAAAEAERTKEVYLMRLATELDREIRAAG